MISQGKYFGVELTSPLLRKASGPGPLKSLGKLLSNLLPGNKPSTSDSNDTTLAPSKGSEPQMSAVALNEQLAKETHALREKSSEFLPRPSLTSLHTLTSFVEVAAGDLFLLAKNPRSSGNTSSLTVVMQSARRLQQLQLEISVPLTDQPTEELAVDGEFSIYLVSKKRDEAAATIGTESEVDGRQDIEELLKRQHLSTKKMAVKQFTVQCWARNPAKKKSTSFSLTDVFEFDFERAEKKVVLAHDSAEEKSRLGTVSPYAPVDYVVFSQSFPMNFTAHGEEAEVQAVTLRVLSNHGSEEAIALSRVRLLAARPLSLSV
jgi:hypothetical protein